MYSIQIGTTITGGFGNLQHHKFQPSKCHWLPKFIWPIHRVSRMIMFVGSSVSLGLKSHFQDIDHVLHSHLTKDFWLFNSSREAKCNVHPRLLR